MPVEFPLYMYFARLLKALVKKHLSRRHLLPDTSYNLQKPVWTSSYALK